MKKRKKVALHKSQVKTTISVVGIVFLGVALIISMIAFGINYNNSKLNSIININKSRIHRINNIASIQDNLMEDLMTYAEMIKDPKQKLTVQELAMDHYKNITTIKKSIQDTKGNMFTMNKIMSYNNILLIIIIIVVLIQGLVLYVIGMKIGHKYSGPLIVISKFMSDYIKGKNPELRALREGDELQEFYTLFEKTVNTVKERERELYEKTKKLN